MWMSQVLKYFFFPNTISCLTYYTTYYLISLLPSTMTNIYSMRSSRLFQSGVVFLPKKAINVICYDCCYFLYTTVHGTPCVIDYFSASLPGMWISNLFPHSLLHRAWPLSRHWNYAYRACVKTKRRIWVPAACKHCASVPVTAWIWWLLVSMKYVWTQINCI